MNKKKTLHQRRDLQHTHRFKKLNETVKIEAQNLIVDYQRRQHSFFQQKDASAQKALRDTNNNVGQQNKPASKLYQSVTNTAETDDSTTDHSTGPPADDPKDPNTAERNEAPLISKADSTPWNICRSSRGSMLTCGCGGGRRGPREKIRAMADPRRSRGLLSADGRSRRRGYLTFVPSRWPSFAASGL
ncbi:hypothetical protein PSHT_07913 [Puccinia striiformis]|uniref:Uncharacterized protein n=1 Tax=Puccinia striiformis TaxID=27350 RepID=A0A2S4VTU6_9BASI|nr:hypothetical protein PSHT_07913 [Puccinia striiformis]